MRFSYELVGAGWASAVVSSGEVTATVTASYLDDALGDLLTAVWRILQGDLDATARWTEEPGEYRWRLTPESGHVAVRILEFPGMYSEQPDSEGLLVFEANPSPRVLGTAVSSGARAVLDRYGLAGYREKWHEHDFPIETLQAMESWLARDQAAAPPRGADPQGLAGPALTRDTRKH